MLTHARINARFVALDTEPAMLATAFDGWLAWPIVKERLWLACLAEAAGRPPRRSVPATAAAARIASGLAQSAGAMLRPRRTPVALLYDRRVVRLPDGSVTDPHLGIFASASDPTKLHYLYSWGGLGLERRAARTLLDHDIGALAAAAARLGRRSRAVAATTERLAPAVLQTCPELAADAVRSMIADQLARFRVRSALFRRLYRRWQVSSVIVLDPDGKVAEVAAAKASGLPVIEVQHGMFGTQEPDYSWTVAHRTAAAPLPVADTVVVFGSLWRCELITAGYWAERAVVQAANPIVGPFRRARAAGYRPPEPGAPLAVLFASQGYVRGHALAFWRALLAVQRQRPALALRIKVHPMERNERAAYDALAAEFPEHCTVVTDPGETYPEMLRADVVAGYTSLMLVEAIGMGIPTVGLRGGAAEEGLLATFGMPELAGAVEEVASADGLLALLRRAADPGVLATWTGRVSAVSDTVFDRDGPPVESVLAALTA
jgi:hypothetical protein